MADIEGNETLEDELEAINSIYGVSTLVATSEPSHFLLQVPGASAILKIGFSTSYPATCPTILGVHSTGSNASKGHGITVLTEARNALADLWTPGEEVMHDLISQLEDIFLHQADSKVGNRPPIESSEASLVAEIPSSTSEWITSNVASQTLWAMSQPVLEKKSLFMARACRVTSKQAASAILKSLPACDKRLAKATHNISAYRILMHDSGLETPAANLSTGRVVADCDDDGETAAGGRLARLLQLMKVSNVLVVVSRWYGGVKLGPDRFRIINQVAREAIINGGWTEGAEYDTDVGK